MPQDIGSLFKTQIAGLSDAADIQEAFRLYHYGKPTGTGAGQYDTTNTDPDQLNPDGTTPSIAWYIYNLQNQIDGITGDLGVAANVWEGKGYLVTAIAAGSVQGIAPGSNGQVLTANSSTATGLQWSSPEVTLSNTVTLTNKNIDLTNNSLTGTLSEFNTALSDANFATLAGTETLTNKTIDLAANTITGSVSEFNNALQGDSFATLAGTETLTNKTLTSTSLTQPTMSTPTLTGDITFDVGRGDVLFENNASSNADGAGLTIRTTSNPTDGSIFDVRSSGNALRLFAGQSVTSSGDNPFLVNWTPGNEISTAAIELSTNGTIRGSRLAINNTQSDKDATRDSIGIYVQSGTPSGAQTGDLWIY